MNLFSVIVGFGLGVIATVIFVVATKCDFS